MAKTKAKPAPKPVKMRSYISQTDIPSCSLEKALTVPTGIGENYGFQPSTPLQVAQALGVQPTSSGFKMLTGAAIAYGVTAGGYNSASISITPLGMRIVRRTIEGDDDAAKKEALLRPRVIREFLQKYNGASVPKDDIGRNILMDMGVPLARTGDVLALILEGAESLGLLKTIKDRKYVDLSGVAVPSETEKENGDESTTEIAAEPKILSKNVIVKPVATVVVPLLPDGRARKVFITHGKNKALIEPITKLLAFGELEAVVSVQTHTVSQPVPGKVMEEMRSCGAAIIHVEDERHLLDREGKEHIVLNDNVLIEIGAAMALYGQRFILVVQDGVKLPSNLQGLFETRYKGTTLDMEETVKLLEAIKDMKSRPLP